MEAPSFTAATKCVGGSWRCDYTFRAQHGGQNVGSWTCNRSNSETLWINFAETLKFSAIPIECYTWCLVGNVVSSPSRQRVSRCWAEGHLSWMLWVLTWGTRENYIMIVLLNISSIQVLSAFLQDPQSTLSHFAPLTWSRGSEQLWLL